MPQNHMLRTADLDYELPSRLIATRPAEPRDAARLLVVSRSDPRRFERRIVRDLPGLLEPGDALVFNTTSVVPARLSGRRRDSGGAVSGLFIEERAVAWTVMLKSNGRLRPGVVIDLVDAAGLPTGDALELIARDGAAWTVRPPGDAAAVLTRAGATPLPPYILRARRESGVDIADALDRAWYQTTFAKADHSGSVAAPTAGLHFTTDLLDRLDQRTVHRLEIALRVGPGTFKPVDAEYVEEHDIHAERWFVPRPTLDALRRRRAEGGRVIAVGTTSARALESIDPTGAGPVEGETRLLITPGRPWRVVDGLMTNFHLPRSTLMAMVAALFPEGAPRLLEIYRAAVAEEFRFYSYGDAMLILP